MKPDSKLEETYKKILKECIALFDLENQKEREKIAVALKIGKNVDELVNNGFDKEKIFKRLTRDIFRARHKAVSLSKIAEYHQLYLDFGSMETINSMEKTLLTDMTLNQIVSHDKDSKCSAKAKHINPLLEILEKVGRLFDKFEAVMDNYDLTNVDVLEINGKLSGLQIKMQEISKAVKSGDCKGRLFNGELTPSQ